MSKLSEKLLKLGNRAIKKAQENNRKKGIPNVYCINGKIIFIHHGKMLFFVVECLGGFILMIYFKIKIWN